jgi:uncharacterized protein (DUF1684 family)
MLVNATSSQRVHGEFSTNTSITKNAHPVYQNDQLINNQQQYLYYWESDSAWRIGADYNSERAEIKSAADTKGGCPDTFSVWLYSGGSLWTSSSITASCEL